MANTLIIFVVADITSKQHSKCIALRYLIPLISLNELIKTKELIEHWFTRCP